MGKTVFDVYQGKIPFFSFSSVLLWNKLKNKCCFSCLSQYLRKFQGWEFSLFTLLLFCSLLLHSCFFALSSFTLHSFALPSFTVHSFAQNCSYYRATVSNLLSSLFKKEQLLANCSYRSLQMSDRNWFAPVALDIRTTLSKLLSLLFKKEHYK